MSKDDFPALFARLKALLATYAPSLKVVDDTPGKYYLETGYSAQWKKPLFFGSAIVQKNYVSFYLMPVYMFPDLLEGISPALKKRMQGKSCFNFKQVDETLLTELEALTRKGFARFQHEGLA
jgi:hypothetical protein